MVESQRTGIEEVDWAGVASSLIDSGWIRLEGVVGALACARLAGATAIPWEPHPEVEGEVHQGGLRSGVFFDRAAPSVQQFGRTICDSLTAARADVPAVPCFNEVQWGKSHDGIGYITAHRDPPAAGGVIAIVTLRGRALFRVWQGAEVT